MEKAEGEKMEAKARFGMTASAEVVRHAKVNPRFLVKSKWEWEHVRAGKIIDKWTDENIVTNEGLDALLDIMFHGSTQITTWYVLIFEDDHTPAAGNTYAVPGFTESTAYDEANRPAFVEAAASGQSMTNSANKATFTIDATKTIYGTALVGGGTDADTKDDAAGGGTLYASVAFGSSKAVVDDDELKVTITLTASDV